MMDTRDASGSILCCAAGYASACRSALTILTLSILMMGCASPADTARAPVAADAPILEELGFLNESPVTRDVVVARLGDPSAIFEAGRIVSYSLTRDARTKKLRLGEDPYECYALTIEYASDDTIARRALIRRVCRGGIW